MAFGDMPFVMFSDFGRCGYFVHEPTSDYSQVGGSDPDPDDDFDDGGLASSSMVCSR